MLPTSFLLWPWYKGVHYMDMLKAIFYQASFRFQTWLLDGRSISPGLHSCLWWKQICLSLCGIHEKDESSRYRAVVRGISSFIGISQRSKGSIVTVILQCRNDTFQDEYNDEMICNSYCYQEKLKSRMQNASTLKTNFLDLGKAEIMIW